jgi:hypothetical protein
VKVLHRHLVQSREYLTRFKREAHAASRFRHENAVKVLGTGLTEDGLPYIAMDLVEGRSLKEIAATQTPMAPGRAANLTAQLLRALGAAHRSGIVHRDMKPDNIRVVVDDDGIERPRILDFGIVKFIAGDLGEVTGGLKTKTGVVLGTPKYMAPEQIRGEAIDGRADIYSVGAMLHELLTGKPPFQADDVFGFVAMHLKERVPPIAERYPELDVPEGLDELLLRMLEKDPKDRPGDAIALADEIARFAVEDPRAAQKVKALSRGVGVVAGAGVVGAILGWVLTGKGSEQTVGLSPAVAASALGLGVGAGAAARLFPRPSVYGFVKRLGVVAAAVFALGIIALIVPGHPGAWVAASLALTALLCYAGYLLVWGSRSLWMRPVAAGVAAPLLALALAPVFVAPANGPAYYTAFLGSSRGVVVEKEARNRTLVGTLIVALCFGLASMTLPRPGAARR